MFLVLVQAEERVEMGSYKSQYMIQLPVGCYVTLPKGRVLMGGWLSSEPLVTPRLGGIDVHL